MARAQEEAVTSKYALFDNLAAIQEVRVISIPNVHLQKLIIAQEFYTNGTGPYTAPSGITNGFQKLTEERLIEIGAEAVVEANLGDQSHIEYLFETIFYPGGPTPYYTPLSNESYLSVTASSMVQMSRGNVTLRGNSMSAAPVINPNVSRVLQVVNRDLTSDE